jgi:hypothetical protein
MTGAFIKGEIWTQAHIQREDEVETQTTEPPVCPGVPGPAAARRGMGKILFQPLEGTNTWISDFCPPELF